VREIDRTLLTKELGKAQAALWAAFTMAARANELVFAKSLREQHKALGTAIAKLNGGPVITIGELLR